MEEKLLFSQNERQHWNVWTLLRRYSIGFISVAIVTLLGLPIKDMVDPTNLVMLYLAAVVFVAVTVGRGPSIIASIASVLTFDFFFVHPVLTFSVYDTQYLFTFFGLFIVGLVVSSFTSTVRDQAEAARKREEQMAILYVFSRDLTQAKGLEQVLEVVVSHTSRLFERTVLLFLPEGKELREYPPDSMLSDEDKQAAVWAFRHQMLSGCNTNMYPKVVMHYIPLFTSSNSVGVMGINLVDLLPSAQNQLLKACASLAAIAIERVQLEEQANLAHTLRAAEQLQKALFDSISHDLRTPLVTITGVMDTLYEIENDAQEAARFDSQTRMGLLENGREQTRRLNRLVGNLLDMTRLETGALKLHCELYEIQEVVGAAMAEMRDRLNSYRIETDFPASVPMVIMDFVLIRQVVINLLENAVKYSPPGSIIRINAEQEEKYLLVSVRDHGIGIPANELEHVFEKFYRLRRPGVDGLGLGLSICKGIVEAHGGRTWAQTMSNGSQFFFTLPLQ